MLCHQAQLNEYHVHILYVPQNKDLIPSKCKNVTKSMIERNSMIHFSENEIVTEFEMAATIFF